MARGFAAVAAKLAGIERGDIGALFKTTGMTLLSTVGGASGPLYGTLFLQAATKAAGKAALDLETWNGCLAAGILGIQQRGKAEPGDKTMLDALLPAVAAVGQGFDASAKAAEQGATATIPLVARKGRASYLGERSAGHQDPGATSSAMLLRTLAEVAA
jgi:dihydroxyacetone kinase-like protein